jgi:hypothetical protein
MWCTIHRIGIGLMRIALDGAIMGPRPRNAVRTSVLLPEEAHARIQALAASSDVSAAWVIRQAVLKFLDVHGDQTELPLHLPVSKKAVCQ